LKKRLGCLHAHYSNIETIEQALSSLDIELVHFVDPGLMEQVSKGRHFTAQDARQKVKEQIEWIACSQVDAILITCTNYIAFLEDQKLPISIPIIKIDELYFKNICQIKKPQVILFSNPATVEGTMNRLTHYAAAHQNTLDTEVIVIEHTFDLLMQGQKDKYIQKISEFIKQMDHKKVISVAQLSMVAAARKTGKTIIHPLSSLASVVEQHL
jgi:aspartate/glutamate racemase